MMPIKEAFTWIPISITFARLSANTLGTYPITVLRWIGRICTTIWIALLSYLLSGSLSSVTLKSSGLNFKNSNRSCLFSAVTPAARTFMVSFTLCHALRKASVKV